MKRIILLNAIVWAALILIISYLFKDSENYFLAFGSILVGFTFVNGLLYNYSRGEKAKHNKQDRNC